MLTDIEIAERASLKSIDEVALAIDLKKKDLMLYGSYMAKALKRGSNRGKLILVTAVNPTPAGEGKTTVSIGLADGMKKVGRKVALALREPSLGPVFGLKGGATGGGRAQIVPMDDINLHFTGDMHAITSANNLLAAIVDNHIFSGNELNIKRVVFHRCMDMNERTLRSFNSSNGLGDAHFDITAASEVMSVLCLASDEDDLKSRLSDIIVGYSGNGLPVTARDLKATDAMAILLKDAMKPNLVQTLEGTPAFVHGGPFANIAHGCNSIIATKTALSYADYVVTEAGFGADLGAEKFFDIKCRISGLKPSCVVLVATVRALKYNGGVSKEELSKPNLVALAEGSANLLKHIENITTVFKLPCVVALNRFVTDTADEIEYLKNLTLQAGAEIEVSNVWEQGGEGGIDLAERVLSLTDAYKGNLEYAYPLKARLEDKIEALSERIYGADGVTYEKSAMDEIKRLRKIFDIDDLPICMAKTQYSFSDDASKLGRPRDFKITVREVQYRAGAGFVVVLTGTILQMPGLPKVPAATQMTIENGKIRGIF